MLFFIIYLLSSDVADCGKEMRIGYGKHTASVLSCISSVSTLNLFKYMIFRDFVNEFLPPEIYIYQPTKWCQEIARHWVKTESKNSDQW